MPDTDPQNAVNDGSSSNAETRPAVIASPDAGAISSPALEAAKESAPQAPAATPAAKGKAAGASSASAHKAAKEAAAQAPAAAPEEDNGFKTLGLPETILKTLKQLGYETPTQIQSKVIPKLLGGFDIMGQAQTGTGKTAAFALPAIARVNPKCFAPQCMVLAPTRELAIQVAESFKKYGSGVKGFQALAIYGGQPMWIQLKQLQRGVHVVVGTPGRMIDHIKSGSLDLSGVTMAVLDEADEMLRMGFIDDVEWILDQTPKERQTAVFSATLPPPIRRIAEKQMRNPEEICIAKRAATADTIKQSALLVGQHFKLEAITRILEAEVFDAMLIFVRTKLQTNELADKLAARGYDVAPLSGDLTQSARERAIQQLKSGKIDIVVATDVAARGLDVDRISHVVNYDMPYDPEDYIHRIGRTGRAGRTGEAIIFVTQREMKLLKTIEHATRQRIDEYELPSAGSIIERRVADLKRKLLESAASLNAEEIKLFGGIVQQCQAESQLDAAQLTAALVKIVQAEKPLSLPPKERHETKVSRGGERPVYNDSGRYERGRHNDDGSWRSHSSAKRPYNKGGGGYGRGASKGGFAGGDQGSSQGGSSSQGYQSPQGGKWGAKRPWKKDR